MLFPKKVKIVEVGPRDGLQNETNFVPTETKIEFINQLSTTGLTFIEVTSFVSPKWIPQLADHREVFHAITKKTGITYSVLVPNLKGFEAACAIGVKNVAVFTTPSEEFSMRNTNCSVKESLERIAKVVQQAKAQNIKVRAYLSCVLGCPYEGEMAANKVANIAKQLYQMGCDEISLGDTIGVGTPFKAKKLLEVIVKDIPLSTIAFHFHDTYGQALANIYAVLEEGVAIFDSAIAGLGGCPYAKGASGNVATEDVIYLLNGLGIQTGIDLNKLITVGKFISLYLNKKPASKVNIAFTSS